MSICQTTRAPAPPAAPRAGRAGRSLTDLDLTPVQNTAMHLISATPGSSSAELARHTHVTPQTMHKLVADLEQRGLLTLHPRAGHGRILDAHLTNQGRQVMADADKRAKAIEARNARPPRQTATNTASRPAPALRHRPRRTSSRLNPCPSR